MRSVNKCFFLGNVGKDPEIRSTGSGTLVANFSVALSERVKQGGDWTDKTEWVSLVAFGKTAEIVRDYVRKGSKIHVIGRVQTSSWDDRQTGEKKYKTNFVVEELSLLSQKQESGGQRQAAEAPVSDDDVPF